MKRLLLALSSLLVCVTVGAQAIHSVDITADVRADGGATIVQVWDVDVVSGTEWYIPIENLGEMEISNLTVAENGFAFQSEGDRWDVDRTLEQKARRCGIVRKRNAVELCWGQGSMGHHVWTASFAAKGLVQGFDDYDGFNFMFVNPGLGRIERAKVVVRNATGGPEWTSDNVRVWAFGFKGNISVVDGEIVCESTESMPSSQKVIILARFDKGMLEPEVSRSCSFEKLQNKAFRGSDYNSGNDDSRILAFLFLFVVVIPLTILLVWLIVQKATGRVYSKKMFGKNKITGWCHDVPQEGNLFAAYYVLKNGDRFIPHDRSKDLIGACMLKWVLDKKVIAVPATGRKKRYDLQLKEDVVFDSPAELSLYNMVKEAAGENMILEANEMERWSKKHCETILGWPDTAADEGMGYLLWMERLDDRGRSTLLGQEKASEVIQFKTYLKDFTLSGERGVPEVTLWKDYLVFAQLYGIADEVTAQLKKLYPADFDQFAQQYDTNSSALSTFINLNRLMTYNSIMNATNARASSQGSGRIGGLGGFSSLGGGGGFSGGGFGGGSR